jgi:hypothetical protein
MYASIPATKKGGSTLRTAYRNSSPDTTMSHGGMITSVREGWPESLGGNYRWTNNVHGKRTGRIRRMGWSWMGPEGTMPPALRDDDTLMAWKPRSSSLGRTD